MEMDILMDSGPTINIEVDLGIKGVQKTDIYVYLDGKLIGTHMDRSYDDIQMGAADLKSSYPSASLEVTCEGEDFFGRIHRWNLDL